MATAASIRHAVVADAVDISKLMASTSDACCFSQSQPCPDWYHASLQTPAIEALIISERLVFLLATHDHAIAGVLAIEDKSSIKYFFVDPAQQKIGLGKRLWQFAKCNGELGLTLKVRSSLCAVPVCARLGFIATEPPSCFKGLHYQTMVTLRP